MFRASSNLPDKNHVLTGVCMPGDSDRNI